MISHSNEHTSRWVQVCAFLTVPLACWQKWIFPSIPNYHLQHGFVYFSILFLLWAWFKNLWSFSDLKPFLVKAAPWLAALFVFQGIAFWQSAEAYLDSGQAILASMLTGAAKLAAQLLFALVFLLLCVVLTRNAKSRKYLLLGAIAAFISVAIFCVVQGVIIYGVHVGKPEYGWLYRAARALNRVMALLVEAQWNDAVYDFYSEGSYTQKLFRMNGVFEEASVLAAWVGTFFFSIASGLIALRRGHGGWIMAVACLVILVASTSFAAVVFIFACIIVLLLHVFAEYRAWTKIAFILLALAVVTAATYHLPQTQTKMAQIKDASLPRVTVPLATLEIVKKHPLFGVGRGWFTSHVVVEPIYAEAAPRNFELKAWKAMGRVPQLCAWLGLAAEYGLPAVACALFALCFLWKKIYTHARNNPDSALWRFSSAACGTWVFMVCIAAFADIEIRNPLFLLPLFGFCSLAALPVKTLDSGDAP